MRSPPLAPKQGSGSEVLGLGALSLGPFHPGGTVPAEPWAGDEWAPSLQPLGGHWTEFLISK